MSDTTQTVLNLFASQLLSLFLGRLLNLLLNQLLRLYRQRRQRQQISPPA